MQVEAGYVNLSNWISINLFLAKKECKTNRMTTLNPVRTGVTRLSSVLSPTLSFWDYYQDVIDIFIQVLSTSDGVNKTRHLNNYSFPFQNELTKKKKESSKEIIFSFHSISFNFFLIIVVTWKFLFFIKKK